MAASGDDVIRYYDENIGKYFSNKYGESVSYKENSEKKFLINNVTNFSPIIIIIITKMFLKKLMVRVVS